MYIGRNIVRALNHFKNAATFFHQLYFLASNRDLEMKKTLFEKKVASWVAYLNNL